MALEATRKVLVMVLYGGNRQRAFLRLFRGDHPASDFIPSAAGVWQDGKAKDAAGSRSAH